MKNLYDSVTYQECLTRIKNIKDDTKPEWGEMTTAQMLSHCAAILDVANGKELKGTPFIYLIKETLAMGIFGLVTFSLAAMRFQKRLS